MQELRFIPFLEFQHPVSSLRQHVIAPMVYFAHGFEIACRGCLQFQRNGNITKLSATVSWLGDTFITCVSRIAVIGITFDCF
jgi:hypothetical protein